MPVVPGGSTRSSAGRVGLIITTVLALLAVGSGVLVATGSLPPDLVFQQTGHWVYNKVANAAFHIDEGTQRVDAKVDIPEAPADPLMTLEGQTQGFVVARDKVIVFGKSTLTVDSTIPVEFTETPVGIETVGGPYLVYRETGSIVRLGVPPVTIQAGGRLDRPAYTDDGTLWVHRPDTGAICALRRDADRLDCALSTPPNVPGSLTVTTALPAFVSYPADAAEVIKQSDLAQPVGLGADLPDPALLSDRDGGGRLAAVYPDTNRLVLTDSAGVPDGRPGGAPVTVELGPGKFGAPWQCQNVVAVLDEATNRVLTYDVTGSRLASSDLPSGSFLTRGSDCTLYVDSADGTSTHVVDSTTGQITSVDTVPTPDTVGPPPPGAVRPVPPRTLGGGSRFRPPVDGGIGSPEPVPTCGPERVPTNVRAELLSSGDSATVTWTAPTAAAGKQVSYRVTGGGREEEPPGSPAVITQVVPGQTLTLVATIDGKDCSVSIKVPLPPPCPTPSGVRVELVDNVDAVVSWNPVDGAGKSVAYRVTGTNGVAAVDSATTSATIPNLAVGIQYTFRVQAIVDGHPCPPSLPTNPPVMVLGAASAPTNLAITGDCHADRYCTVTWDPPAQLGGGVVAFYDVDAAQNGRELPGGNVIGATSTSFGATELSCGPLVVQVTVFTQPPNGSGQQAPKQGGSAVTNSPVHANINCNEPDAAIASAQLSDGGSGNELIVAIRAPTNGAADCLLRVNTVERWRGTCTSGSMTIPVWDQSETYRVTLQATNFNGAGISDVTVKRVPPTTRPVEPNPAPQPQPQPDPTSSEEEPVQQEQPEPPTSSPPPTSSEVDEN